MIKVAGVPEHFNLPWYKALESGLFRESGLDVAWTDVPEGTGRMCQMLREGAVDVAVLLTEGIVRDIAAGNPSRILQVYVQTPLVWGIHVAAHSSYQTVDQLQNARIAISRPGSGSQLMAYVHAKSKGWKVNELKFDIVNTIDGAIEALTQGKADYFMWERFMTKPLVDQGIFRKIGECPTPWPCFVIAARQECIDSRKAELLELLRIVNRISSEIKEEEDLASQIAERFKLKKEDAAAWLAGTQWSQEIPTADMLNNVQNHLLEIGLMDKKDTFAHVVNAL